MSYIRWSTKVRGQKNASRTYAWWDCGGGVVIAGRSPDGKSNNNQVLVSVPEMLYMSRAFLEGWKRYNLTLKQAHKGFYKKYDETYEKDAAKRLKAFQKKLAAAQKVFKKTQKEKK